MKNTFRFCLLLALLMALSACSKKGSSTLTTYIACPKPVILRQLSKHVNRSGNQIISVLTLERVAHSSCQVKKDSSWLEATVRLSVTRGPAFPVDQETVTVPYFLAVADATGRVIAKTNQEVTLTFDDKKNPFDKGYTSAVDLIRLDDLATETDAEFDALQFMVGLQVTPEE